MKRTDLIFGILGLALTAYIWLETAGFPEDPVVRVGPAFFPRMLAAGLGLSSLALICMAIFRSQPVPEGGSRFSVRDPGIQRAGIALGATILYCLLLEWIGFIPLSIIYLLTLMVLLKEKKYLQMVITAVAVTAVLFLVFSMLLHITLPMGSLYGF